jgi:hypothetical protein
MARTDELATLAGRYTSDCCDSYVVVEAIGDVFPPCPNCGRDAAFTCRTVARRGVYRTADRQTAKALRFAEAQSKRWT